MICSFVYFPQWRSVSVLSPCAGGESIKRGDGTGGKPLSLYQLHVRGKYFKNELRNQLQPTITLSEQQASVNLVSPSLSSTDHWDANTAGSTGDEGLRVPWSAGEEEGHQVSVLRLTSQLLAEMNIHFHLWELLLQHRQRSDTALTDTPYD